LFIEETKGRGIADQRNGLFEADDESSDGAENPETQY
jgi:hypothetical protein